MGPDALPHVKCSGTRFCADSSGKAQQGPLGGNACWGGSSGQSLHTHTRLCVLSQPREHRHSPAATNVSGGTHLPRAHQSLTSSLSSLGLRRRREAMPLRLCPRGEVPGVAKRRKTGGNGVPGSLPGDRLRRAGFAGKAPGKHCHPRRERCGLKTPAWP